MVFVACVKNGVATEMDLPNGGEQSLIQSGGTGWKISIYHHTLKYQATNMQMKL